MTDNECSISRSEKESHVKSEERFRSLVQSISGYLYSIKYLSNKPALTYHSPQCEIITGYTPEDYAIDPNLWIKMVYPDDINHVLDFFKNLQSNINNSRIEHRIIHKNGAIKWVLNQCAISTDDTGMIVRADGLVLDITGQKESELALFESEKNFKAIFDNAVDGILIIESENSKFHLANKMFCHMLGYSETDINMLELKDIHPKEALPHITRQFDRQSRQEINLAENIQVKRKDGSIFYADINSSIYMLGGKKFLLSIFRDISERKSAETLIRNSEKKYRDIIASTPEGYCRIDSNCLITEVNDALCKMLGYSKDELLRKSFIDFTHKENEKLLLNQASGFKISKHAHFEINLRSKNGCNIPTIFHASALKEGDLEQSGYFAFITDISTRKENENDLIKAKENAEAATKLKDKFVSLVAHDLRGPITTMWGYLQLLGSSSSLDDSIQTILSEAMGSCEDMTVLINEILNLSRLKTGGINPQKTFINSNLTIKSAIQNLINIAEKKGVSLINKIPNFHRIYADEKLFQEVIRNLLSNSIKFCRSGDTVTLFIPERKASTIAVSDSGIGIERKRFDSLFKYEEKTSTIGTEGETGTGLGLPLAYDLIEAHGGELSVESKLDSGTTFYIKLPHIKPKILIVDDERLILNIIKELLNPLEAEIIEAPSTEEALNFINTSPPHLILLDILMPETDGFALLEILKKNSDTKDIPVIVITGDPKIETRDKVFELGALDFVEKPFKAEDLLPRVKRFIY